MRSIDVWNSCLSKRRYKKLKTAERIKKIMNKKWGNLCSLIHIYKCSICDYYHIGKIPFGQESRLTLNGKFK